MSELGIFYPTVPSGDGDLKIANVSFVCEEGKYFTVLGANAIDDDDVHLSQYDSNSITNGDSIKIIIYKDYASITVTHNDDILRCSVVSGDAETYDTNEAIITGDCTLRVEFPSDNP